MINVTEGIVGRVQMCHLTNCHANVELKLPFHQYNVELSLRNAIELVLEITISAKSVGANFRPLCT